MYATTDGSGAGFGPAQVWTSKDFVNWTLMPMNWPDSHWIWAPDVMQHSDGKYYYLLVRVSTKNASDIEKRIDLPYTCAEDGRGMSLITVRSREAYSRELLSDLRAAEDVVYARCVNPVYDILPIEEPDMPFTTAKEMFDYAARKKIPVWQAALDYERAISGLDDEKLMGFAENLWDCLLYTSDAADE